MKSLLLFIIIIFYGCGQSYVNSYKSLESAFIEWYLKYNPIKSSKLGFNKDNSTIKNLDLESIEEYVADIERFRIELTQIDYTKLPSYEKTNFELIKVFIDQELFDLKSEKKYEWDSSFYIEKIYESILSILDIRNIDINLKTQAINSRLAFSNKLLEDGYDNLKYYSIFHKNLSLNLITSLNILLDDLPLKLMSDNQTLDQIDDNIRLLKNNLKRYKNWLVNEYSRYDEFDVYNEPNYIDSKFKYFIGKEYSISKISKLAKRKVENNQNLLFDLSLPFYLQKNDEPVWVDRDDSLFVIDWMYNQIDKEKVELDEYISTIYLSSKKIKKFIDDNDLVINKSPDIEIKYDEEYFHKSNVSNIGRLRFVSNTLAEYLVLPLNATNDSIQLPNNYHLEINLMKDLYPGRLILNHLKRYSDSLLRRIISSKLTDYGWESYIASYLVDSGYGGGKNYAYKFMNLYEELKIATLSWMELEMKYYKSDEQKVILKLNEMIHLSTKESEHYLENIQLEPLRYTKQFIGTIEMNRLFSDYSKKNNNINSFKDFQSQILNEGSIQISQLRDLILN